MDKALHSPNRRQWHHRYSGSLGLGLACFCLGAWLCRLFWGSGPLSPAMMASLALVVVMVGVVLSRLQTRWGVWAAIALLAISLGAGYTAIRLQWVSPFSVEHWLTKHPNKPLVNIEGVMTQIQPHPRAVGYLRATLALLTVDGQRVDGPVRLWKTNQSLPPEGTHVMLTGRLRGPNTADYPGDFDEAWILRSDGISGVLQQVKDIQPVVDSPVTQANQWQQGLAGFQDTLQSVFYCYLPKAQADMLAGVVLGSRASPIDPDVRDQFASTGLIHFLAASGLNVGIVAGAGFYLVRLLPIQNRRQANRLSILLALMAVLAYAILAGLAPSVLRATAMVVVALAFKWRYYYLHPVLLLLLAITALTLWQPAMLGNLGFQLSVLTTFGIIVMVPPCQRWLGHYVTEWGAALVLVPVIAQAWVLPIIASTFHQVAWHSVALNMVAAIVVAPLTLVGFTVAFLTTATTVVPALIEPISWLTWLAYPFATALLWLAKVGNQFPGLITHPPHWPAWLMVGYYSILALVTAWLVRPPAWAIRRRIAIVIAASAVLLTVWTWHRWWDHQHGELWWLPIDDRTHLTVLRPPQSHEWLVISHKPLSGWHQRSVEQHMAYRAGGKQSPRVVVLSDEDAAENTLNLSGGYQVIHRGWAWQLVTADRHCVWSVSSDLSHTTRCSFVVWDNHHYPAKLWDNTQPTSHHPNWIKVSLPS